MSISIVEVQDNTGGIEVVEINQGPRGPQGAPGGATSVVLVQSSDDLSGTLDSTKTYFIDGIIDMGTQSIEVPAGGLNLTGSTFDVSQLISSEDSYTMFTTPGGGSGNLLIQDIGITASGTSSQVFDLTDATGFNAFEIARINFNDCTSLGEFTNYRQGFETGTGRFGGTPNLTLSGTWGGGYFIDSSIVRSLDAGMTGALYQAGAGFSMSSRFRSNQNIDLPANAAFVDFSPSNFPNPSTLQLQDCIITRDGVANAEDPNITPNIERGDLPSAWKNNNGMLNTYVGGTLSVITESTTSISTVDTWETLAGTWLSTDLEHFDVPASGQLRHLGDNPRDFEISASMVIDGGQNDVVAIKFRKWDDSASAFVELDYTTQNRVINNLQGPRDVAYYTIFTGVTLDQNDYIYMQVKNTTDTTDVTAEAGSFFRIQER